MYQHRSEMAVRQSPLLLEVLGTEEIIHLDSFDAVVAGYTGRDKAQVQEHIDELAAIGVAPPPQVPMFYEVDSETVTTQANVDVDSEFTSGEVEPVYIRHKGQFYLGIASDHTDRHVETENIGDSKRACPKPISATVLKVDDIELLDLDDCLVECYVDGLLYQQGRLSGLRAPGEVVRLLQESSQKVD